MHSKYQRRLPHAERAQLWKRQTTQIIENSESSTGGFVLTAPITLTIIQTLTESSTSASTASMSSSSSIGTTSSSTTEQSTSSTSTSSSQTPTETFTFSSTSSSVVPPTTLPSEASGGSSATPIAVGSLSSSNTLPGGAIAAIVIAVLIAFVGVIFYLIRSKSRRNRMKLRPLWTQSKAVQPSSGISSANYDFRPSNYSDSSHPVGEIHQVQSRNSRLSIIIPGADVPVPPTSYNNNNIITVNAGSSTAAPSLAVYSPSSKSSSPFGAVVVTSFITNLPDELPINIGEKLRILAEYDDGWSLCMNNSGEQGMVPVECLSRGGASQAASLPPSQSMDRRSSRLNSLGRS